MKILCSKKEDILRRKAEFEEEYEKKKHRHDRQTHEYRSATVAVQESVKDQILKAIGETPINLDVRVRESFYRDDVALEVYIAADENDVHGEHKALSWSWATRLDKDGNVVNETGSWSGLNATTAEQLDSLRETLRVLEILNQFDWAGVLKDAGQRYPKYDDYVNTKDPRYEMERPNFESELFDVDLEEALNEGKLVKGTDPAGRGRGEYWYHIIKINPKTYNVAAIPGYAVDPERLEADSMTLKDLVQKSIKYPVQISKDKFRKIVKDPIETMEVE